MGLNLDAATSEYLPGAQADLAKNLEICDLIKSRQVSGRDAMRSIKRRLCHRNPNVQLLALELTDSALKNTSPAFLRELASREFVDVLISLCREDVNSQGMGTEARVISKTAQEKLQSWVILVGNEDGLTYLREAYEQAQREGIIFPSPSPSQEPSTVHLPTSTIVHTEAPPEWTDSPICQRCNVHFSLLLRKHHCRSCGKTFCQDCSGKTMILPEMGFGEELVRVCETCFAKRQKTSGSSSRRPSQLLRTTTLGGEEKPLPSSSEGNLFEDDLARAIELSLQETQRQDRRDPSTLPGTTEIAYDEEAALARAIAESLREEDKLPLDSASKASTNVTADTMRPISLSLPAPASYSLISPIERENIQLFNELVQKMSPHDEELEEADFLYLAQEMRRLQDRLQQALAGTESSSPSSTIDPLQLAHQRLLQTLQLAFHKYEQLTVDYTTMPTQPRSETGSIMRISMPLTTVEETTRSSPPPLNLQPISVEVVPALQPQRLGSKKELNQADSLTGTMIQGQPPLVSLSDDEEKGSNNRRDSSTQPTSNPLQDIVIDEHPLIDL